MSEALITWSCITLMTRPAERRDVARGYVMPQAAWAPQPTARTPSDTAARAGSQGCRPCAAWFYPAPRAVVLFTGASRPPERRARVFGPPAPGASDGRSRIADNTAPTCPPSFSSRGELPRTPDAGEDARCEDTAEGSRPSPRHGRRWGRRCPGGGPTLRPDLRPGVSPRTPTLRRHDPRGTPCEPGRLRTRQPRLRNRQIRVTVQAGPDILRHPGKPTPQEPVLVNQPLALLGQQASRPHELNSALRRRIQPLPEYIPSRVQHYENRIPEIGNRHVGLRHRLSPCRLTSGAGRGVDEQAWPAKRGGAGRPHHPAVGRSVMPAYRHALNANA